MAPSAFMTFTYKAGFEDQRSAGYVAKDWRALWRRLRHSPLRKMTWLRVMEVTRKGTPHHHLLIGPFDGPIRCYGKHFDVRRFLATFDSCRCASHAFSRQWLEVTGDSFIVHAVPVVSAKGAAKYMAKYLSKTFGSESRLETLGMTRRWSTSRGYPGSGQLKLKQTDEGGWIRRDWVQGNVGHEASLHNPEDLMERKGDVLKIDVLEQRRSAAAISDLRKRLRND